MLGWLEQYRETLATYGVWAGFLSLGSLAIAAILLPLIVVQLPDDYFVRAHREPERKHRAHPVVVGAVVLLKNTVGIAFLLAGLLMIFLPGQGLLTLLIGLILTNFPGKYRIEQKLIRRPAIARTLNRFRERAGRGPFRIPDDC
jgi:amino acid transporter